MRTYLLRRLLQAVPLLFGVTIVSFLIVYLAPGDPALRFISPDTSMEDLERMRHVLGLDQPLYVQYWRWLTRLLSGDWGHSFVDGRPVLEKIGELLPATLELTVTALLLSLVIAVPIGVLAATRQYSVFDFVTTCVAFIGVSIPSFWLGLMLMLLFAVYLKWLPATGRFPSTGEVTLLIRLKHLALPAFTLGFVDIAGFTRYMRSSMLEVVRQDYIRTARAKGVAERMVIYRHALRNALLPIITLLGLGMPALFSGAAIIESLFAWPGMGRLFVQSAFTRDYPVIMAGLLIAAILTILGNLAADIAYALVDPRIKYD